MRGKKLTSKRRYGKSCYEFQRGIWKLNKNETKEISLKQLNKIFEILVLIKRVEILKETYNGKKTEQNVLFILSVKQW